MSAGSDGMDEPYLMETENINGNIRLTVLGMDGSIRSVSMTTASRNGNVSICSKARPSPYPIHSVRNRSCSSGFRARWCNPKAMVPLLASALGGRGKGGFPQIAMVRRSYAVVSEPAKRNVASCPVISLSRSFMSAGMSFAMVLRTTSKV